MNSFINAQFQWPRANRPSRIVSDGSDNCSNNNIFCKTQEIVFGNSMETSDKQYRDADTDRDTDNGTIFSRSRAKNSKNKCSA